MLILNINCENSFALIFFYVPAVFVILSFGASAETNAMRASSELEHGLVNMVSERTEFSNLDCLNSYVCDMY